VYVLTLPLFLHGLSPCLCYYLEATDRSVVIIVWIHTTLSLVAKLQFKLATFNVYVHQAPLSTSRPTFPLPLLDCIFRQCKTPNPLVVKVAMVLILPYYYYYDTPDDSYQTS
jgi:hypothetical protein